MDIRQCRRCRKIFNYISNPNCPVCVRELDEIFHNVRNYLYEHPKADMEELCEQTDADEEEVITWLREGRLILAYPEIGILRCETCDKPIASGRYCEACSQKVKKQLESTAQTLSQNRKDSSRFSSGSSDRRHVDF